MPDCSVGKPFFPGAISLKGGPDRTRRDALTRERRALRHDKSDSPNQEYEPMAVNKLKLISATGPVGAEKKVNEWFEGEGASVTVKSIDVVAYEVTKDAPNTIQKILVTIWY